jgi:hypothetical protein
MAYSKVDPEPNVLLIATDWPLKTSWVLGSIAATADTAAPNRPKVTAVLMKDLLFRNEKLIFGFKFMKLSFA